MSYKAVAHLDHADMLEVAIYRKDHPFDKEPISSITVECTKCGEVVEEIYNASEDNTPPLDCEFPDDDPMLKVHQVAELFAVQAPTVRKMIKDGILPAVRIDEDKHCRYRLRRSDVEAWMKGRFKRWEDGVKDAARIVQNEIRHKKAIDHSNAKVPVAVFVTLSEVELHLAAMLSRGSYESHDTVMQTTEVDPEVHNVMREVPDGACMGDSQPITCPDCGGTGSDCAKHPIAGCATCEGDGRVPRMHWTRDRVQFARLLCDIIAALDEGQTKDLIIDLCRSMDLGPDDVNELFDRAEQVWEKAKAEVK